MDLYNIFKFSNAIKQVEIQTIFKPSYLIAYQWASAISSQSKVQRKSIVRELQNDHIYLN